MNTTSGNSNPLVIQKLPLMEHFYTIQGEGAFSGRAAYFLRLGGCDVGCVWCDVKESWNAANHPLVSVGEMVKYVSDSGADYCVITGGEPAIYDLLALTTALNEKGIQTAIETSGAYPLSGNWHHVCFSPKKFKAPVESIYPLANELKVIVFNKSDFVFAEEHASRVNEACLLFLQPEWEKEKEMLPLIIEYIKSNPRWRISLQTHKYMNIP
ncbi:MAG TPA: 7-carboxy-7-deazaguanine synthase QueE [Flavobacteriales bacterium]|nr:7-carboxy-7-deazaguanine synthase QueE [Flavobacteriales bacterium]HRE97393.1 7-carboxy-7-deazaguanine synthase QueE [Flavobacteriales bacterium]HRJ36280.1 7-carboxy-7-deazaguanine synthase QueE [Flavobacteriales bacterium]HRJ38939.1 7-carboxy-7-deazaguanine synthase QueE [Flavobacteriales bacterium]